MDHQSAFFAAVSRRNLVRVRVAAIVIEDDLLLVQRPADDDRSCYALIGGEYEIGDTFESRIRREFEEETTARVTRSEYLFVVENRFRHGESEVQSLEHYFRVGIDTTDVQSKEPHLVQRWLPLSKLDTFDLRPLVVRQAIVDGTFVSVKHLVAGETDPDRN